MTSKRLANLLLVLGAFSGAAALAAGCSSSDGSGTGGGGGTTTTTSSTTKSTTTTTKSTTTSTGDGDDTIEQANSIAIGETPTAGALEPVTTDADYYQFDGKAGQAVAIFAIAQTGNSGTDPTYADTVITLYNEAKAQIAQNDDPKPYATTDAGLYTQLPTTGVYYVRVSDCVKTPTGKASCHAASKVTTFDYEISVVDIGALATGPTTTVTAESAEASGNDTTAGAATVKFAKSTSGGYSRSTVLGKFDSLTDVDVYAVKLPVDTSVNSGARAAGYFYPDMSGVNGNGSGASVGRYWLVDSTNLTTPYAELDVSTDNDINRFMAPPMTLDRLYYLFVQRASGGTLGHDFYFLGLTTGYSNPVEKTAANDTAATAEVLTERGGVSGAASYYVDGDITPAPTDVDYFALGVPAGLTRNTVTVACKAQRRGSGLRDARFELRTDADAAITGGSATETATADPALNSVAIPAGATKLLLRVSAGSQSPTVTSTFYRCGVQLK